MNRLLPSRRNANYNQDDLNQNLPPIEGDKTAWDHYNERARIDDREYVKDWNENLANLLIFAALFSAILTAFIIESMKLLQEDPQETTNSLLQFMAMQAVNATRQNATVSEYIPSEFTLKSYVVAVNCLFFSSLSLSLLAALASIIILQWVGRYDAGILSYPAAKDRALHRQFRYDGVIRWKMNDLIGALPYLLYFSLVFFFIGMIVWLFNTNTTVSIVVSIFFLIGILVYVTTTIIAVVAPSSPFRTPLSDFLTAFLFQSSTKSREEREIGVTEGFSLHTLMALMETIEIVPHSYSTLTTVAREIVCQPYYQLFTSGELVLHDRWKDIFQAVLSSFSEKDQRQEEEKDKLLFESLADYTVALLVQELPRAKELSQQLFELFPSTRKDSDVRKLIERFSFEAGAYEWVENTPRSSTTHSLGSIPSIPSLPDISPQDNVIDLVGLSPVYVYSIIFNLPTINRAAFHDGAILSWLSQTIRIPLEELSTKPLLSETAFQSLLTAASVLICSDAGKKGLANKAISSIQDFSSIVTSVIDGFAHSYSRSTFGMLTAVATYHCAQLARNKDSHNAIIISQNIRLLMIPHAQKISSYFPIYELLYAYSLCGLWPPTKASKDTLEKMFGLTSGEEGSICLKILVFLDNFFARPGWHPSNVKEDDARNLLLDPLFGTGWGWINPCVYSPAELIIAKDIKDPTLRLIASASSGHFLDLDKLSFRGCRHDTLLAAAAAYWISRVLWDNHQSLLSLEELELLQILISVPQATEGLNSDIPAEGGGTYIDDIKVTRGLNRASSSLERFTQLLMTCNEWTLDHISRETLWHLTDFLKNRDNAIKILSVIDASQHSLPLASRLFRSLSTNMREDIQLVEAGCLLWIDILQHGAHDKFRISEWDDEETRTTLNLQINIASRSLPCLWVKDKFSRILPQQISFREHQLSLGVVTEGENGLWEWHLDLGFVPFVAFAPDDLWDSWVVDMKGIGGEDGFWEWHQDLGYEIVVGKSKPT